MNISKIDNIVNHLRFVLYIAAFLINTLMFVVYLRKNLRKISVSTYIITIAIAYLILNVFFTMDIAFFKLRNIILNYSEFSCQFYIYLTMLPGPLSAWLETAAGFDRFLIVIFPAKFVFLRKLRFQMLIIMAISVFIMGVYLNSAFKYHIDFKMLNMTGRACFPNIKDFKSIEYPELFVGSTIPFVLMAFSSTATFLGILKSRNRLQTALRSDQMRRTRSRDIKFGVTMISLNILFLLMVMPYSLRTLYYILTKNFRSNLTEYILARISKILRELFYSFYFLLQISVNSHVRNELLRLVRNGLKRIKTLQSTFNSRS